MIPLHRTVYVFRGWGRFYHKNFIRQSPLNPLASLLMLSSDGIWSVSSVNRGVKVLIAIAILWH